GHPVVAVQAGHIGLGSQIVAGNLVAPAGALGDFNVWTAGTPFFTQLHDDLGALLDNELTTLGSGNDAGIPAAINNQILARLNPALGPPDQRPTGVLVLWFDTV